MAGLDALRTGATPDPMDDIFTMGSNASMSEVKDKMRALPAAAKQQFIEGLKSPEAMKLLQIGGGTKRKAGE